MSNTDSSSSKWHRVTYLLPLIVPVVIIVTFVVFYNQFLLCSTDNPCAPFTADELISRVGNVEQVRVAAYVGRAHWTLVNGVHLLACLAAVLTAGLVIYHALSDYDTKVRWMIILIVVALAADISLVMALWAANDTSSPAQQLFQGTIGQVLPSINKYNRVAEALSLTGTLSLAAAACATLWRLDTSDELEETQLLKRVNLLRPVLYVGAVSLAIAVLRLSATHTWGASYLPPASDLGKSVASLITGIVGSLGTLYTLVIAGVYLPAALLLRARIRELALRQPDSQGWLASRGLTLSFPQYLPRVIALLGPLLAGPLGDLLARATTALGG